MNRATTLLSVGLMVAPLLAGCSASDAGSPPGGGGAAGATASGGVGAASAGGSVSGAGGGAAGGITGAGGGAAGGIMGAGGLAGTGGGLATGGTGTGGATGTGGTTGQVQLPVDHVFVIVMENHDGASIYGNTASAPYINDTLMKGYGHASNFVDPLPVSILSQPHYMWMEAGTNVFSDHTFSNDDDPSASNSTSSTDHLVTQIEAKGGLTWVTYQEGMTAGSCPITGSGFYAPKHDPFVYFQDVAGNPPSASEPRCVAHHKPLSLLAGDLKKGDVASYTFITPNLCNDMHGQFGCPSADLVRPGDDWLSQNVPALISFCEANGGVIFIVWDEGEGSPIMPFLAVGPGLKPGYTSPVEVNHASLVKSVEEIFGLPILPAVSGANDFADYFLSGKLP